MRQTFRFRGQAVVSAMVFISFMSGSGCRKTTQDTAELQQQSVNPIQGALMQCDYAKALSLAQAGDKNNDATAKFYLGRMYQEGWGVPQDVTKSLQYYQEAAAGGYQRGKVFAAGIYLRRHGAGKSNAEGRRLLKEAADQGDVQGKYLILLVEAGRAKNTPERDLQLKQAMENAAAAGDPLINFIKGAYFSQGWNRGKPIDAKLAMKHLLIAANSNTQMPGVLAASSLLESGLKLGGDVDAIKKVVSHYADAGGLFLVTYEPTCVRDKPNALCDPVQVIKYGKSMVLAGNPVLTKAYLASLTEAQIKEGERLAAQWKLSQIPSVSPDYYLYPELTGQ